MTFQQQARSLKHQLLDEAEPAVVERIQAGLDAIGQDHPAGRALRPGERAPDFELSDVRGGRVRLSERLAQGPVVLVFYRGGWCPFCSLELQAWGQRQRALETAGGSLLAVSPEAAQVAVRRTEQRTLGFPLLVDTDQAVARRYGLAFTLPRPARDVQTLLDAPLERLNADGSWMLPVPATYVIDTERVIRWAYVDDDYTTRGEPDEAIAAVRGLPAPATAQNGPG